MKHYIALLVLLLVACNPTTTGRVTKEGTIKIGAVLPLTGDTAIWGINARNGMELALQDINSHGGINGTQVELIVEDGQCDAKTAVNAMQKLVSVDHVPVVLGEVCSGVTLAMAPIAQDTKTVLIAPCSEGAAISQAGDYVFRTWVPNTRQAQTLANFAFDKLQVRHVEMLAVNNALGEGLVKGFTSTMQELGGTVNVQVYNPTETDFKPVVTKALSTNPDAVYVAGYIADSISVVKELRSRGYTGVILAASPVDSADFVNGVGNGANGIYFTDLQDTTSEAYKQRYDAAYNVEWPGFGNCPSVGYDALAITADAMRHAGTDASQIQTYLSTLHGFPGVSGAITFDENGDLTREHAVFRYVNGTAVVQ